MKRILFLVCVFVSQIFYSQVGVNISDPKATLDVLQNRSNSPEDPEGVLIPRLTIDEINVMTNIGRGQNGMLVYDTDNQCVKLYRFNEVTETGKWVCINTEDSTYEDIDEWVYRDTESGFPGLSSVSIIENVRAAETGNPYLIDEMGNHLLTKGRVDPALIDAFAEFETQTIGLPLNSKDMFTVIGNGDADITMAMGVTDNSNQAISIHAIRIEEDLSNAASLVSVTPVPENKSVLNLESLTAASDGSLKGNVEPLARILMSTDGVQSYSSRPGRISFQTTSDNAIEPKERIRIDKDGNVIVNDMQSCSEELPLNSLCYTFVYIGGINVRVVGQKQ